MRERADREASVTDWEPSGKELAMASAGSRAGLVRLESKQARWVPSRYSARAMPCFRAAHVGLVRELLEQSGGM